MLQNMFYIFGIIFFLLFFYDKREQIIEHSKVLRLKVDIGFLLMRVPDLQVRQKAASVFLSAKTVTQLESIKNRLIEITTKKES